MHSIHRILAAAESLVHLILLHFTHEEQLLVKLSLSSHLRKKLSDANMEFTDQFIGIKAELEQGKIAPVLCNLFESIQPKECIRSNSFSNKSL